MNHSTIHPHMSGTQAVCVILTCILVLLICKHRHTPIYHRELTLGYLLGMVVGIPLAALRLIIHKYRK